MDAAGEQHIKRARESFLRGLSLRADIVNREILESIKRSKALGVNPDLTTVPDVLTREEISALLSENRLLICCARDILKNFFKLINDTGSVMMLLDREAHLLEVIGGRRWREFSRASNIKIGTCFQEKYVGTTTASLALECNRPFEIAGEEYFARIFYDIRDFSVPIHDAHGRIIGTIELAVSRQTNIHYAYTFSLVVAIAGMIENQFRLMQAIEENGLLRPSSPAAITACGEVKPAPAHFQHVGQQARHVFDDILGESAAMKHVVRVARTIAKSTSNVLIVGESGTGKELVAQSIHNASIGDAGPFVAINCAAFPSEMVESELFGYEPGTFTGGLQQGKPGKLELANGGTLFLDEVNGMSMGMQVKLLRVLEEKKYQRLGGQKYLHLDARIISATNQDLRERVAAGCFRSDLYYRLSVVEIDIPPLRQRREDIGIYVEKFIREVNMRSDRSIRGCSREAMDFLMTYSWPGNVRELKNWIERAGILSEQDILEPGDFPSPMVTTSRCEERSPLPTGRPVASRLSASIESVERDRIVFALEQFGGDTARASRHLGIGRATLYRKIKKYGIGMIKQIH